MKLLAIVGTERKIGNSILAAKYISKQLGSDLEILRLTKMDIQPCKACYACLFGEECKIDDDVNDILKKIDGSDAILIASPVYILDATSKIKALMDRGFMVLPYLESYSKKPCVILTFHGFRDMVGWASATHLTLARFFGFDVLANLEVNAALPAEIFVKEENIRKLDLAVKLLKEGGRHREPDQCPVCFGNIFRIENGNLICPVCNSKLDFELNVIEASNRFTAEWFVKHFGEELRGLKEKFVAEREKLMEAAKIVQD